MPIHRIIAHPRVTDSAGRVALMRGPILYCVEAADNPRGDVLDLVLEPTSELYASWRPDLLGGCVMISGAAQLDPPDASWSHSLYRRPADTGSATSDSATMQAIPYHLWANRGRGTMTVWLKRG